MDELIPQDLCDTDLYKFGMGQLVYRQFDKAIAKYRYFNRAKNKSYPNAFAGKVREQIKEMSTLKLSDQMYTYFKSKCGWLRESYLQWLRAYRFNPEQVEVYQDGDNNLEITITGLWFETIFWEVPILYIISELSTGKFSHDWEIKIRDKAFRLYNGGVNWIDFGTRRRASWKIQSKVNEIMSSFSDITPRKGKGLFRGTSNPYFGMRYNLTPHGTNAHELTMAMQARHGIASCNRATMDAWIAEYRGDLGIALTDTITTPVFLRDFDKYYARLYDGIRQDSGDPKIIGDMCIDHYRKLGIDPTSKILVLSDSLTTDKALEFHRYFEGRIKTTMGIGTHLTNDVGLQPSNHVIKLTEIDFGNGFQQLLKLSDDKGKHLGDSDLITNAKRLLNINTF